jgi:enolase
MTAKIRIYNINQKTGKGDRILTPVELIGVYEKLINSYPIKSIEDPFAQDGFD